METWLEENWYWIIGFGGMILWVAYRVRKRGGTEPLLMRIAYELFPVLDPSSEERRRLTPLAVILWGIGIIIVLIVAVWMPEQAR